MSKVVIPTHPIANGEELEELLCTKGIKGPPFVYMAPPTFPPTFALSPTVSTLSLVAPIPSSYPNMYTYL